MNRIRRLIVLWVALLCPAAVLRSATESTGQGPGLRKRLEALAGVVEVKETRFDKRLYAEGYEITVEQPLDHQNPQGERFLQRVFVAHLGYDKPVLLETEGYAAFGTSGGELQQILGGNQVTVEHRFFGRSVPSPVRWEYLTVRQSADDLHAIVTLLKKVYPGKWVSTGVSKGGQTALFFKCYYPEDVDATVAYVAPINVAQEDPRIYQFLQTAGDAATRKRIKDLQITLLRREEEVLPLVKAQAERNRWTFAMGLSEAYEYGVLEYPYAFWQFGTDPNTIPSPDAPAETLAGHYSRVGTLRYYADQGKRQFEPFLYQAFTEMGYYNYDITDFKPYIKTLKNPSNLVLCPDGVKIVYNPATMAFVYHFLQYEAHRVVYIYGGMDAWSATQMQLIGRTDAVKIVVQDSHHGARISRFSPQQKELFFSKLEGWLGLNLTRP